MTPKIPKGHERAAELMQAVGLPLTTKAQELDRTAEMLPEILAKNGLAYVVWFLYDSQCTREDLAQIARRLTK